MNRCAASAHTADPDKGDVTIVAARPGAEGEAGQPQAWNIGGANGHYLVAARGRLLDQRRDPLKSVSNSREWRHFIA
jgi:hypothetical protein